MEKTENEETKQCIFRYYRDLVGITKPTANGNDETRVYQSVYGW